MKPAESDILDVYEEEDSEEYVACTNLMLEAQEKQSKDNSVSQNSLLAIQKASII